MPERNKKQEKIKYYQRDSWKFCRSKDYNWNFDTKTGRFERWGEKLEDDPDFSPVGPEILDLEISTICHGPGKLCKFCYKTNTPNGHWMPFEMFKNIFDKMTKNGTLPQLGQIAFGLGDIDSNPDMYEMFAYARGNGVVPNLTINGWRMSDYHYDMLCKYAGAVAVSFYDDDHCFNAVKELTDRGMDQINIHAMLSQDTLQKCHDLIDKAAIDSRLEKLNAIVFLLLKPKGARNNLKPIESLEDYEKLFKHALDKKVAFGMDSCSAPNLLKSTEGQGLFSIESVEPCESTLFSSYISTQGEFFPCSFTEGQPGWEEGISVVDCDDFLKDVWFNERVVKWRNKLLNSVSKCNRCVFQKGCRSCPEFPVSICKESK